MNRRKFFEALFGLAAAPLLKFVPEEQGVPKDKTVTFNTGPLTTKFLRQGTTYHFYPDRDQRSGR